MTNPSSTCHAGSCTVEVHGVLEKEGLCLNHYLDEAFRKLAAATEDFHRGEDLDYGTMDWLLAQVDFAVEWLAREDTNGNPDQRSRLLELLLGVANLNEYVRHNMVLARPSRLRGIRLASALSPRACARTHRVLESASRSQIAVNDAPPSTKW